MKSAEEVPPVQTKRSVQKKRDAARRTPALLEFPGVNRSAVPEWRQELGERVREVQEKRAREASLEAGEVSPPFREPDVYTAPALELLPQAELPLVNPLVVAALRRIERARSQPAGNIAAATAVAYETQLECERELTAKEAEAELTSKPERVHNLAVVPSPTIAAAEIRQQPTKPRKVIDERNPALNYLDSVPTTLTIDNRAYSAAPIYLRGLSALTDLAVVCLLSSPFLALTELTNLEWRNPRVISFAAGTWMVVGFLYLTVSIAFTGRTIGMKLFSLRVVDARTGLIPTGGQSAGRALVYILSLASAGIALAYTFFDSERRTAHDRFTRTAVIRV
jgi:uncharacterized RDD family membrane protein YckC